MMSGFVSRSSFVSLVRCALVLVGASLGLVTLSGCQFLSGGELPDERPRLANMEEPLELFDEPDDESVRLELPPGCFSGIYVTDSRQDLDALLGESDGVLVERIVENSPAALADIRPGDLLIEATTADGDVVELQWPSDWRQLELEAVPKTQVDLLVDRAGAEIERSLEWLPRARPATRADAGRFREEEKVGVVLRTATEVEARTAGLGPGAGAVIVGLAANSPWRRAGLQFEDLVVAIDNTPVSHPQVVLDAIRSAGRRDTLKVEYVRGQEETEVVRTRVTRRAGELREIHVPLLLRYEDKRGKTELSAILGLISYRATEAAWRVRLLWLFSFGGGSADRLEEVKS